jgi:hypothetical protein
VLGLMLGDKVGLTLGLILGDVLGLMLGDKVGLMLGDKVGLTLGLILGDVLGLTLGWRLGDLLGLMLGDDDGVKVNVNPEIRRTRLFETSPTNANDPSGEMQIPSGLLNLAFVPTPFVEPADEPARVLTEAVEMMICRIK